MTDDRFVQSYKSPAFHQKIRIVALQNAPENPKNKCSSVCKSQNVCPLIKILNNFKKNYPLYPKQGDCQLKVISSVQ